MTLPNCNVIEEMSEIFELMHARLDYRFEQLMRQVNSDSHRTSTSNRILRSRMFRLSLDKTSMRFSPVNRIQLEDNIQKFGRLTISTSLNSIERLTNSALRTNTMYRTLSSRQLQPMNRATLASAIPTESIFNDGHGRIIGKRGRQKGQFSNPQDVLIMTNPNRTLLVSDTINQSVQIFSCDTGLCTGTFLSSSKSIPLRRPIGLSKTFNDSSACFVTDYDQHLISHWTIDESGNGKLTKKFGQKSLLGPKGLCVSKQSERIIVADNKANCICLFDSSGLFLHRFGTRGAELHELAGPHYVQLAEEENARILLVTDFYNNCVKIFDLERQGQIVTSFGSIGTKNGLFQAPTGLAIDYQRGYIFVSDWGNNRIQIFDRQGTFIRPIELPRSDMLYGPQGLDYEPLSRTLAIANSGKHSAILVHID